eukprot:CAMPEP_0181124220 /NCGR_PEP_ID=MMETSP1071-20121207/26352_1 /TAXON_ID=35127 /ORGANISM="Thalassiosira sp., Strain NH16" /LENGTH=150 /DNA_ID=CAMNT_0023209485 /DNA_START=15 /DNA_END=463 /DNA_ORIENTATION=-
MAEANISIDDDYDERSTTTNEERREYGGNAAGVISMELHPASIHTTHLQRRLDELESELSALDTSSETMMMWDAAANLRGNNGHDNGGGIVQEEEGRYSEEARIPSSRHLDDDDGRRMRSKDVDTRIHTTARSTRHEYEVEDLKRRMRHV